MSFCLTISFFLLASPHQICASFDVTSELIRLKLGTSIGNAVPKNEFVLDSAKGIPASKILGSNVTLRQVAP
jgi:hypothetical protein